MSGNIILNVEGKIKTGALEEFKKQLNHLSAVTLDNEPDSLIYEWYLGEDGETFQIYERYKDPSACVLHLTSFIENHAQDFQTVADTTKVTVYGAPDEALKQILDGFGALFFAQIGGFKR